MPLPDRIGYADLYEVAPTSAIDRSGVRPLNEWMEILNGVHAGYLSVHTSDDPPPAPFDGSFWWQSSSGRLFVRYNDGNSTQWCETVGRIAGDISEGRVTSDPGGETKTLGEWMADVALLPPSGVTPDRTQFWPDQSETPAQPITTPAIWRMRERVFMGAFVENNGYRVTGAFLGSWVAQFNGTSYDYPMYGNRDAVLSVASPNGAIGIASASRASDWTGYVSQAPIAISGAVVNDRAGVAAWGGIIEAQHESTGSSVTYGWEFDIKNKTALNVDSNPYTIGGGTHALWLAGGGAPEFGGLATYPTTTGIAFKGAYVSGSAAGTFGATRCFNAGITFHAGSLSGCDGTTGFAHAIQLARGHIIQWYGPGSVPGGSIRSDIDAASSAVSQIFGNNTVTWYGNGVLAVFAARHAAGAVNYMEFRNGIAGTPAQIVVQGNDTNIDLYLTPKGAGLVKFGAYVATPTAVTGYISIRDSSGNTRKLAVIS